MTQLKRAALKQLFRDPRFNVMDGLDTYIDDYTQADPIAPDVLADLLQRASARRRSADRRSSRCKPKAGAAAPAAGGGERAALPPRQHRTARYAGTARTRRCPTTPQGAEDGRTGARKPGAPSVHDAARQ